MTPPPALVGRVRARLAEHGAGATPERVAAALRSETGLVDDTTVLGVVDALRDDVRGAGPLARLLDDPRVTDVLVNAPDRVYVDRGCGLELTGVRFDGEPAVRRLAQRAAAAAGRRLDDASPCADVRMPSGVRLHAVLPPVSPAGTVLSLRIARRRAFALPELVAAGAVHPGLAAVLDRLVRARLAFLVTGGTGSGKTTVLATLLGVVPPRERLVLVEDAGELLPDHPHVVRLEARPANVEGRGEVPLRTLVRQALRMRPDRLVVGEVRGAEVVDLLSALNTGHEGGCGTVHANGPAELPARIEALGVAAGLSRDAVHSQLAAGLDAVVHVARDPAGRRRVDAVCLLRRTGGGVVVERAVGAEAGAGSDRLRRGPAFDALLGLLADRGAPLGPDGERACRDADDASGSGGSR